jgi:hypothetical protein
MCWNATVSLNTFLFSTFGAFFGLINNANWKIILYFYFFSSMQFIEYKLWKNISDKSANEFWSKVGFAAIFLQPYIAINIVEKYTLRNVLFLIYTLFLLITIYTHLVINFTTTVGPNKHLAWNWLDFSFPICLIWTLFIAIPFLLEKNYIVFVGVIVSFFVSYYLYAKDKTFGSMWCWVANIAWVLVILHNFGMTSCLK